MKHKPSCSNCFEQLRKGLCNWVAYILVLLVIGAGIILWGKAHFW